MKERRAGFLKFIVIYKAATGISALIMAVVFFKLRGGNLPEVLAEFACRNGLTDNPVIQLAIKQSAGVSSGELTGLAALALAVGIIDIVESAGLSLRRRWAEWMTVALTAVFIPFEVYEMAIGASFFKGAVIVINCVIVYYLAMHRELFKAAKGRLPDETPDKNT
ncbi:MAG: DUF2127 domain-containing protein [Deltaproteobacteria bacterium]|nr:DUF2127 domain-containing protein [Deltaproteobacteria bacterium]